MKKLSMLVVFLVFVSSVFVFAGEWGKLQASGVVDVAIAENGHIAIANKSGELWISKDAGKSWTKNAQAAGVARVSLNSNATILGIVNKSGEFWVSKDMGSSWLKTKATGVADASVGRSNSFIVNRSGEVWYTADLDKWTKTTLTKMKLVVFGGPFLLLVSDAGAVSVADFKNAPSMALRTTQATGAVDIDVAPNGHLWVVNGSGQMWSSPDKGVSWSQEAQAAGVAAVSICNKYTIIANTSGEVWLKTN